MLMGVLQNHGSYILLDLAQSNQSLLALSKDVNVR